MIFQVGQCVSVRNSGVGVLQHVTGNKASIFFPETGVFYKVLLEHVTVAQFCRGV